MLAAVVGGRRDEADDARLGAAVHDEAVDEEARLGVLGEVVARSEGGEGRGAAGVDRVRVLVGACGQVDLGANDVEEREVVSPRELAGFVDRDDVVRDRGDALGVGGKGAQSAERADGGHGRGRGGE